MRPSAAISIIGILFPVAYCTMFSFPKIHSIEFGALINGTRVRKKRVDGGVLFPHCMERLRKTVRTLSQDSRCPDQDSKLAPPGYKSQNEL
jgi:hypothetical protein